MFLSYSFLSSNSSESLPVPYPIKFIFFVLKTKEKTKLSLFCVSHIFLGMGLNLPWSVVDVSGVTSLKKTDFLPASNYHLE